MCQSMLATEQPTELEIASRWCPWKKTPQQQQKYVLNRWYLSTKCLCYLKSSYARYTYCNWKGTSSSKPPFVGSISIFGGVFEVVKYQGVQKRQKEKTASLATPPRFSWSYLPVRPDGSTYGFLGVLWGRCQGLGQSWSWDFSWRRYNQQEKINWKNMLQIESIKHINTVRGRDSFFCGKIKRINNLCLLLFRFKTRRYILFPKHCYH